jgi:hypothetical protein
VRSDKVILELSSDEMMIFNSLMNLGLSDFSILAQMADMCGISTKIFKSSEIIDTIKGCVAS